MALIPIIQQTWDTTSYVNPTRMNNIETNLGILSKATGIEYSTGVSVKEKIDEVEGEIPEIADNLTTDDSTKALSAKQGKVLNDKIDSIATKQELSITTDASGNYTTTIPTNRPLICAIKRRFGSNMDIVYTSLGDNYYDNAYLIHFTNPDGTPYANKSCDISIWYI